MQAAVVVLRIRQALLALVVLEAVARQAKHRELQRQEPLTPAAEAVVGIKTQIPMAQQAAPVSSFFATESLSRLLFRPSHLPAHSRLRLA